MSQPCTRVYRHLPKHAARRRKLSRHGCRQRERGRYCNDQRYGETVDGSVGARAYGRGRNLQRHTIKGNISSYFCGINTETDAEVFALGNIVADTRSVSASTRTVAARPPSTARFRRIKL
jgi:hypothetical protein